MTTSEPMQLTLESLTSLPGDFPVKTYHAPIPTGEGWKVNGLDSSLSLYESFARLDPVTSYWKTFQRCLENTKGELWEQYSMSFSKAGTLQNGRLYRRQAWERRTYEKGFSLLPTVSVGDTTGGGQAKQDYMAINRIPRSSGHPVQLKLRDRVKLNPTLTAQDAKNSTLPRSQRSRETIPGHLLREGITGELNPEYCEWLMGFPAGWTELEDLEMP